MTAKPQQTDQSNAADDLIAELARLMAQDAAPEKPAAAPAFSLRIPGEPAAQPSGIPAPRFDFSAATDAGRVPEAAPTDPQPAPASVDAGASGAEPEPFQFDFGPSASEKASAAAAPVDFGSEDAIAQLIEAELANEQVPVSQTVATSAPAARMPEPEPPAVASAAASVAGAAHDQFRIPPVFGLAAAPKTQASPVPPAEPAPVPAANSAVRDPIDEIESLIGRAVQVGLEPTPAPEPEHEPTPEPTPEPAVDFVPAPAVDPRPTPSPALRSLATPTLKPPPQPAARNEVSAVDETIMAAAQATGARLEWVEAPEASAEEPRQRVRTRPRLVFSRAVAGPAVALTLLLAAGFGLYWVLGLGTPEGPAPLLVASTEPTKEVPEVAPEAAAPQQSVVFSEMAGGTPDAEEQLVSRDQTEAIEVAAATTSPGTTDTAANRKVRTVTVRPDGTIVSGEESLAGGAILPVSRPEVPEVPGAAQESPLLASIDAAAEAPASDPAAPALPAEAEAAIAETAAAPAVPPVEPGTYVAAVDVAGNPIPGKTAPVPLLKPQFSTAALAAAAQAALPPAPTTANALMAPAATQQASLPLPPAAAAAPAPAASAGEAPAYIQLSSQRTEEAARASAQEIVTRFGPLFGGANLEVQRVDLGERGIFYRVRAPAASLADANTVCTNIKAAGGDCFTM